MEEYSVIITKEKHHQLSHHLIRPDEQEDLCFATYNPSTSYKRFTGIISEIIVPEPNERTVHGNVSFKSCYFERALNIAMKRKEGLVFLHSHPFPGWQGMSEDDVVAENRMSPATKAATGLPLLGMTIGNDESWSARFWIKNKSTKRKYDKFWCSSVRVLGEKLNITFNDELIPPNFDSKKQLRTISAWGKDTQENLSRLKIGIIGLGSVGSIVAEILSRTGISHFTLIDFDSVEEKNLDRTNVLKDDIGRSKVDAIRDLILRSGTSPNIHIEVCEYSICEKEGFLKALGCDVLFSCVDRPWPREVLNFISYAHLIPVIDGGILVRTNKNNTKMVGADWKVQTIGYKKPCLECLGQYESKYASLEKSGLMDDPSYMKGMEDSGYKESHENVYPFSTNLASLEVFQLLSLFIAPSGIANLGQQMYHFVIGSMEQNKNISCNDNCFFQTIIGLGDKSGVTVHGKHKTAENARMNRNG